jgi:hypothetical protein
MEFPCHRGELTVQTKERCTNMAFDPAKFTQLCQTLAAIDLFGDGPPPSPWGERPTITQVRDAIEAGTLLLPSAYQTGYATPLLSALPSVLANLATDPTALETLTGAVYDHVTGSQVVPQLQRFLAVISNLYRSFLDKAKREAVNIPSSDFLPPLAMFQSSGRNGPFTLPCDDVTQLFASSVGVVSLPSTYRDHPVIWAALAHETGGHDVTHADAGLVAELGQGIQHLFGGGPLVPTQPLNLHQFLGALWNYWIDEASADVYGLLNIGPQFAFNLAAFFAALNERAQPGASPLPSLRTTSGPDEQMRLDPHPTDIVRLHLAIGAIENLTGLAAADKDRYIADISSLAQLCAQGATTVTVQGDIAITRDHWRRVNHTFPLTQLQSAAHRVGAFIVTTKLQTLGGHSIQDIETWDDADEAIAQSIATAFQGPANAATLGDDAQLLAGATAVLLARPELYDSVTEQMVTALDQSFATDPVWRMPQPDLVYQRSRRLPPTSPEWEFATSIRDPQAA